MTCQARRGSDGQTRCAACRIVVDADETLECVRGLVAAMDRIDAWTTAAAFADAAREPSLRTVPLGPYVDPRQPGAERAAREPFVSALAPDPWSRNR